MSAISVEEFAEVDLTVFASGHSNAEQVELLRDDVGLFGPFECHHLLMDGPDIIPFPTFPK